MAAPAALRSRRISPGWADWTRAVAIFEDCPRYLQVVESAVACLR